MTMHNNTSIEPHAAFLKKPGENSLLYKIVQSKHFTDMIENDYLYFKKVDTYADDKRDSDQPEKDKAVSRETKFLYAPDTGVDKHYNACRSRTYACCFSTENTSHLWEHYAGDDTNAVCFIFNCHKLINFINMMFSQSILTCGNNKFDNFFDINYGLVTYGDFDSGYLERELPNPIEYVYFKDAEKYQEEKEFRVSLSCLGLDKIPSEFIFADSIKLSFNFAEAIRQNVLIRIELHAPQDKTKVTGDLNSLLNKKGITAKFIDEILG